MANAGWDEIIRLKDQLEAPSSGFSRSRYSVLPLHSMVPAADQRKVFVRPQLGVRKVVLATNIAETVSISHLLMVKMTPRLAYLICSYVGLHYIQSDRFTLVSHLGFRVLETKDLCVAHHFERLPPDPIL